MIGLLIFYWIFSGFVMIGFDKNQKLLSLTSIVCLMVGGIFFPIAVGSYMYNNK